METPKRLVIDVEQAFHTKVKIKAIRAGLAISTVVKRLLKLWLNGKVDIKDIREE